MFLLIGHFRLYTLHLLGKKYMLHTNEAIFYLHQRKTLLNRNTFVLCITKLWISIKLWNNLCSSLILLIWLEERKLIINTLRRFTWLGKYNQRSVWRTELNKKGKKNHPPSNQYNYAFLLATFTSLLYPHKHSTSSCERVRKKNFSSSQCVSHKSLLNHIYSPIETFVQNNSWKGERERSTPAGQHQAVSIEHKSIRVDIKTALFI